MRVCPFCKKDVRSDFSLMHYFDEKKIHIFTHFCDLSNPNTVCVTIVGKTKEEVVAKWNGEIDA